MRISDWSSDVCSSDLLPIGSFQALQHRAAHLYSEMEVARSAVLKAQQLLDAGDAGADAAVSVAKAMTGMATTLSVQESVQMHGGIGMTDEYDVGFYMKRARVLAEMRSEEHTSELQSLMRISYAVFCLKKKNTITKTHTSTQ